MNRLKESFIIMANFWKASFYPWLKEMSRIMVKTYFVVTLLFIALMYAFKATIPLWEVSIVGVYWGYTVAITYWLLKQDVLPELWTNLLHFFLWFMVYWLSGMRSMGIFGSVIILLAMDYWIIRIIQVYIVRRSMGEAFNVEFKTLKNKWRDSSLESFERFENFERFDGLNRY